MTERIIGTSTGLVEKFASDAAHAEAKRIVASAYRDEPKLFVPEGRLHSPRGLRRKPPEAYGGYNALELVERAIDADFLVTIAERTKPSGDRRFVEAVSAHWKSGALLRRARELAADLREFKILEALGLAEGFAIAYGNLFVNEGINNVWNLVCGASATAYNNANARIGVGDSNTAAAATQTDLQAATNKLYQAVDASYPTSGTSQQAVWKATFGGSSANFHWLEWTVDNGASAALNLNRKQEDWGTKVSPASWAFTATATLS